MRLRNIADLLPFLDACSEGQPFVSVTQDILPESIDCYISGKIIASIEGTKVCDGSIDISPGIHQGKIETVPEPRFRFRSLA
jgi:hypothetical protein